MGGAGKHVGERILGYENQGGIRGIRRNVLDCTVQQIF
jgi:hypothetical protein